MNRYPSARCVNRWISAAVRRADYVVAARYIGPTDRSPRCHRDSRMISAAPADRPARPAARAAARPPKSVVIVGAGPGGLAAAAAPRPGRAGRPRRRAPAAASAAGARPIEADGFRFDLGPTFFLYPRVLERIFAARRPRPARAKCRWSGSTRSTASSSAPAGDLDCTPDLPRMRGRGREAQPGRRGERPPVPRRQPRKLERFRPCLERPFLGWRDLLQLGPARSCCRSCGRGSRSTRELGRYFPDPRIRLAFSFQSKYLGMSPFNCPSLFSILSFLEYEYGVWHPIGGCAAVSRGDGPRRRASWA